MKVYLRDIHSEGLNVDDQLPADVIGVREDDDLKFTTPLDIHAHFELAEQTLLAKTNVRGDLSSICSRCLEEVHQDWRKNFFFDFPVNRSTDYVEIDEDLRQEVILNLPLRVLCKEDCKGICMGCGVNLNKEECRCKN